MHQLAIQLVVHRADAVYRLAQMPAIDVVGVGERIVVGVAAAT